jgi:phosphomannomutase/phosphoglucomutase
MESKPEIKMPPQIFREYDLRGLVGKEFNEQIYNSLGKAFGTYLQEHKTKDAVVGYDNRPSSEGYSKEFIDGLRSTGVDVVNIGCVVSPLMYFARKHLKINGGAMITASHNPKEFNGLKMAEGNGCIYGKEIQEIRKIAEKGEFFVGGKKGAEKKLDMLPAYIDLLKNKIKLKKKLEVVLDCGNGTASLSTPKVLKGLGVELTELYCDSDGTFPNHHPDPTQVSAMQDLIAKVKETNADVGIGIDGDGDRIGVVDDKGNILWGDMLMVLFARELLSKKKGAKVFMEIKCSQALWDEILIHGGRPIMSPTGHSIIENKMHAENADLAGEMSGHIYFADEYYGFDDATYAAARLLRLLSNSGEKISEMLTTVPKYYSTPEIRVDCPDEKKDFVVSAIVRKFKKLYPNSITIDGIRVVFDDGWGLVRKSNTQPKLILRFEAKTEKGLERIRNLIEPEVQKLI